MQIEYANIVVVERFCILYCLWNALSPFTTGIKVGAGVRQSGLGAKLLRIEIRLRHFDQNERTSQENNMKRAVVLGVILSACLAGNALGGDPTIDRQALMKNNGAAAGAGGKILKGEAPFDLTTAQLILRTMNTAALGYGYMFPPGSETGNETEAAKSIWENAAGFDAAVTKFITDTSVNVTDEASFKAAFIGATKNCGTCHEDFRVKKQ